MRKNVWVWAVEIFLIVIVGAVVIVFRLQEKGASIEGSILVQSADVRRQVPISEVEVTASVAATRVQGKSDASGLFRLTLPGISWRSESVALQFRRPGYRPLDITQRLRDEIYVIRMAPIDEHAVREGPVPQTTLKDVRVRYATKATMPINVGSIAKTFEVRNTGDVPCERSGPCSPDGKWKAEVGGLTLDAGEGHEFRNVRVSCIAGPCPFTKIESDPSTWERRVIKIAARDWSDAVTFLVEAEVIQTKLSDTIRNAYPAIFGREMSFTLPPAAQGPSIEADINGTDIVYPLGPALTLSWADCTLRVGEDRTKLYRCELRPGYQFQ